MLRRYFLNVMASAGNRLVVVKKIVVAKTISIGKSMAKMLSAEKAIQARKTALPTTHQATDAHVDKRIQIAAKRQAATAETQNLTAKKRVGVLASIRPVAYMRALLNVQKTLLLFRTVKMVSAPTYALENVEQLSIAKTSNAVQAQAVLLRAEQTMQAVSDGAPISASTAEGAINSEEQVHNEVHLISCVSAPATIVRNIVMTSKCGVGVWATPVLENGVLTIRSVWAASQEGDMVTIDGWINPKFEDGVLTIRQAYYAAQTNDVLEVI